MVSEKKYEHLLIGTTVHRSIFRYKKNRPFEAVFGKTAPNIKFRKSRFLFADAGVVPDI